MRVRGSWLEQCLLATPIHRISELLKAPVSRYPEICVRKPSFQTCSCSFHPPRRLSCAHVGQRENSVAASNGICRPGCQACGLKTSGIFHKPKLISRYVAPSIAPVLTTDAFISASVGEKMLLKLTPNFQVATSWSTTRRGGCLRSSMLPQRCPVIPSETHIYILIDARWARRSVRRRSVGEACARPSRCCVASESRKQQRVVVDS